VSCLFGARNEYPSEFLEDTDKEKVNFVREQMRVLDTLEFRSSKANLLKGLPEWLPLIFAEIDNPCHVEFAQYLTDSVFGQREIEFSKLLFGKVEAMGNLADYRTAMPTKGDFLIRLLLATEAQFTEWQDNEPSVFPAPVPTIADLHVLIAQQFSKSNLLLNHPEYRRVLTENIVASSNHELRHHFVSELKKLFDYFKSFNQPSAGRTIFQGWIAEASQLLQGNTNSVFPYYTVLNTVEALGEYAVAFGYETEARTFLEQIVTAEGRYPLSNDVYQGPRKLLLAARVALLTIESE
jgi:hypothetical protein